MSRRWVRWTGGGLLVLFLSVVGWRLSLEIPERVRRAERTLLEAAARQELSVRYDALKLHLLRLHVSIDNVFLRDALADLPLGSAGSVDVSLSPLRFLTGELPVSRVRIRNVRLEAGERNRALYDRWTAARKEGPTPSLPEILLLDGSIHLTLPGELRRFEAVVREVRIRDVRFLGTHVTASLERAEGDAVLPGGAGGTWPFPSIETDVSYKEGVLRIRKFRASRDSAAVRISGSLDTRKRIVSANGSGEVDIAEWIAAGAPAASYVRRVARGGQAELSLRGRVLRLARARAKLWGGVLDADGVVRIDSGRLEGKASLRRVSLRAAPWEALGVPVALAGTGGASVRVAGTPDRIEGAVSFSIPGGMERISSPWAGAAALRFPMSLERSE